MCELKIDVYTNAFNTEILKPDDSESDTDVEETVEKDNCKSNDQDNQKNKVCANKVSQI